MVPPWKARKLVVPYEDVLVRDDSGYLGGASC